MTAHRILKTGARTRVTGPGGRAHVLVGGDVLPEWADGRVGEHLLEPLAGEQEPPANPADPEVSDGGNTAPARQVAGTLPPKGGAGSGTTAWAEYARANDVNVSDGDDRGDIIAALEKAGVPTDAGD